MSNPRARGGGHGNAGKHRRVTANARHLGPMIEIPPYDYFDDAKPKKPSKKSVTLPVVDFAE